ncbi:MAG: aldose 1-epimerase family protein [Solirubrobacteraceae bacterium]
MASVPSGEQFEIVLGEQRAVVVEVGGGVREYTLAGRPVLHPYGLRDMCDGAHGTPLIPWPNRLADGSYEFDGKRHQLALSEPTKHDAIHGLLRWRPWRCLEREPSRVVMGARLHPSPGYPFMLDVSVDYSLNEAGLTVTTSALNVGERACPFGTGQHPYLSPGEGSLDACSLELPASTRIVADPERQLPVGREPVEGGDYDYRVARSLEGASIDSAFTDLVRESGSGRAVARLVRADGSHVEMWVDEAYPYLEVFTADTLAPTRTRRGLAIEPMSCAPNAFRSGEGLVRLEAGEGWRGSWGVGMR